MTGPSAGRKKAPSRSREKSNKSQPKKTHKKIAPQDNEPGTSTAGFNEGEENLYKTIPESVRSGVWVTDKDDRIIYVNSGMEKIAGTPKDKILGTHILTGFPESTLLHFRSYYLEVKTTLTPHSYEAVPVVTPKGRMTYQSGELIPLILNGEYNGIICTILDVTEREQADEEQKSAQIRLEIAMRIGNIAWWEMRLSDGKVTFHDRKATLLGYSPTRFHHYTDFTALLHPDDYETTMRAMRDHLEGNAPTYDVEYRIQANTNEYHWFRDIGGITERDTEGKAVKVTGMVIDITKVKQAELALRSGEEKYRFLIENVEDIVWQSTPDLRFTYLSPATQKLTGYSVNELIGKPLLSLLTEQSGATVKKRLKLRKKEFDLKKKELATVFEVEMLKKDGGTIWLEVSSKMVIGDDGTLIGFQGISRDTTERKQMETALQESEQRLRRFNESGLFGAIYWTTEGKITDANDTFLQMIGYSRDDLISGQINWVSMTPPEFRYLDDLSIEELKATGVNKTGIEKEYIRKNGTRMPILVAGSMLDEERTKGIAIVLDITERKRVEEALRESEERYRSLIDELPDYVIVHREGELLYINASIAKRLGYLPEDLLHTSLFRYIAPGCEEIIREAMEKRLEDASLPPYEVKIIIRDGSTRWVEVRGERITFEGQRASLNVLTDITERKNAETALSASEQKFRTLADFTYDWEYWAGPDGEYIYTSPSCKRITGYTQEEFYQDKNLLVSMIHPDDRGVIEKHLDTIKNTSDVDAVELRIITKDGTTIWIEHLCQPVLGPEGEDLGRRASNRDITERKVAEQELRESEERYRVLLFSAGIGVGYWSTDGILLFFNEISLKRLKGKEEDLIGKNIREIFGDADADRYLERIHMAAISPDPMEYEDYISLLSGTRWYLSVFTRIISPEGTVKGIQVLSIDITDRKQADEQIKKTLAQLERSEALLRNVYDILPIGLWLADKNGKLLYGNPAGVKIWGAEPHVTLEEYGVFRARHLPSGEEIAPNDWALAHTIHKGVTIKDEMLEIDAFDGKKKIILNFTAPLYDAAGTVDGAIVVNQEITDKVIAEQALLENQARLANAMDIARLVNWEFDVATAMFTFDNRFYTLYGTTADREGGNLMSAETYIQEFVYPEDRQMLIAEIQKLIATNDPTYSGQMEHRITPRDGSVRTIIARYAPIMGPDGKVIRTHGANQDITDRKRAEEKLRESEERYTSLFNRSLDCIYIHDLEGNFFDINASALDLLGYSRYEIPGVSFLALLSPIELGKAKAAIETILRNGSHNDLIEYRLKRKDGGFVDIETKGTLISHEGIPYAILGIARDITSRKQVEEALKDSEERLRLALEGADAAFWDWHLPSGRAVFSDRFYTMLDYKPGEFPATYDAWVELMHPDDRNHVLPELKQQILEKRPLCEIEYRLQTKDGNWIWVLGRGKIVDTDEQGNSIRLTGVNIDITNRRLMESEIRSLNTVLEQRVVQRTEELNRSLQEKDLLLREIHHRVKNNLQIVASLFNLQSRYLKDDKIILAVKESQNRVRAMALVHERIYQSTDLSGINLRDYLKFLSNQVLRFYGIRGNKVRISVDLPDVVTDIDTTIPLGLIMNELLSNSFKHAFPGTRPGTIRISGSSSEGTLAVEYHDDGIGIPENLDWKNADSLGLRLVISLVEQLRGTITLDRTEGTTFRFTVQTKKEKR